MTNPKFHRSRKILARSLGLLLAVAASWAAAAEPPVGVKDRAKFATQLRLAIERFEADDVDQENCKAILRDLLGEPAEILTRPPRTDRAAHDAFDAWREHDIIWCYGVEAPGGLPMLGQISFGPEGWPHLWTGDRAPDMENLPEEKELRRLLALIHAGPHVGRPSYNPAELIRLVNALQALGKDRALAVMEEYLRLAPEWRPNTQVGRDGIFTLLHILFADNGHADDMARRIFPLVFQDDLPLRMIDRFGRTGPSAGPEGEFPFYHRYGLFRKRPLTPPNDPFSLPHQVAAAVNPHWFFTPRDIPGQRREVEAIFRGQVLQMLTPAIPELATKLKDNCHHDQDALYAELTELTFRWNAKQQQYERAP